MTTPSTDHTSSRPITSAASALVPARSGRFAVHAEASGPLGRLIAARLGLRPGSTVDGVLTIETTAAGERWTRRFGSRRWASYCSPGTPGTLVEQVGPIGLVFRLAPVPAGGVTMRLASLGVGGAVFALPAAVTVTGDVAADASTDVSIALPLGRCRYRAIPLEER